MIYSSIGLDGALKEMGCLPSGQRCFSMAVNLSARSLLVSLMQGGDQQAPESW